MSEDQPQCGACVVNPAPKWFLALGFDDETWCVAQSEQPRHIISDMDRYEKEWKEGVLEDINKCKEDILRAESAWPGSTGIKFT